MPVKVNRHIFRTSFYDRNKCVLFKSDYVFIRESLENYLDQIRELDTDEIIVYQIGSSYQAHEIA